MDKIKVLLVDDHPVVRQGLRTMLANAADIEVVAEAGDGLEAVEKAREYRPHVVLMDIRMPNLDGLEATKRIKSQLPSTSVIVLTVYDKDSSVMDAIRAGAGGYLLKDASEDLLIHTIRAVNSGGMLINSSMLREVLLNLESPAGFQQREKAAHIPGMSELTPRERDVLQLVAHGLSNKMIGQALYIAEDTVKKHVQAIISKLGVSDRTQAAVKAVQAGFFENLSDETK